MVAQTKAYDDLFRFKIDFVRRRALPLLKAGAHVEATAADHAFVDGLFGGITDEGARELALARAGCDLLDREEAARVSGSEADKQALAPQIESLKRWCAAHVHDPRYRHWVIFRFPETLEPMNLVRVVRPNAAATRGSVWSRRAAPAPRGFQAD